MDFTKFSDENFDLKDWINAVFDSQKDANQNLEQFVATLVTKLQVFIQEINNSIDETSQQTVQNFPRILREIEVIKQEAFMLKEQMKNVREDLLKVEKNTVNESMKLLLDLDIIRTNLLSVQLALQEADNWSSLTQDLDSILQSKDISAISNHIESMQNSLVLLLDDSADYVNRCTLLEEFKNRFETIMSADIIATFNSKSVESSKKYVLIFEKMNRTSELKKYYYQCEKARILEKHGELLKTVNTTALSNESCRESVKIYLTTWLDFLIECWHKENQWCKLIFAESSHEIVINLFTKCIEEFNKSFSKLLADLKSSSQDFALFLDCLNQFKQETDRFAYSIHSSAESSFILKVSFLNDLTYKLMYQIYSPYKTILKQYSTLIAKCLQSFLENEIKMSHPDTVECVQLLNGSVVKVFNSVELEIERCITLTNGCALGLLVETLKAFLKSYIEEFKRVVNNLKERKSNEQSENKEDWEIFRNFVKVIQIVGDLMTKYDNLEELLGRKIHEIFIHRHGSTSKSTLSSLMASNPLTNDPQLNLLSIANFKDFLLEDTERLKLNNLISIIESGDDYAIMKDLLKPLYQLSELVHKHAFDVVFAPIRLQLRDLSKSNFWQKRVESLSGHQNESLPSFAMAPQEYITKIGQYLLTLPQNFEPFTMQDNQNLIIALHKGKLPYLDEKDLSDDITTCWLDSIANATASTFLEEILAIQQLSLGSQQQLVIDIEFISSVFEDVGLRDYNNLKHFLALLKVKKEDFDEIANNMPARIISSVRKIRGF